jgi:putative ABC transport system permease protein
MRILAKTTPEPTSLVSTLRQQIYSLDKDQPLSNIRTMDEIISTSVGDRLLTTRMLGALALVALFLAAVGIYGIMSYAVSQRTHELGIRMAIGAQRWDVLKLVLRQGMLLTLIGIVIGLVGALAISRIIASLLFGITPTDSLTLAVVSLIAAIAALLACLIPARRATRVDPMKALRYG